MNLTLLDRLVLNNDRNPANYIFEFEGDNTTIKKVWGIDNDSLFKEINKNRNNSNFNTLISKKFSEYIDKDTKDAIKSLKTEDLKVCFSDLLNKDEMKKFISQFKILKKTIKNTMKNSTQKKFNWEEDEIKDLIKKNTDNVYIKDLIKLKIKDLLKKIQNTN